MLSAFKGVQRLVGEKAGKVQGTQESEEFLAKLESLKATNAAFKNLQRVGKSIFTNSKDENPPVNPADAFILEIKEVLVLEKEYVKKRRVFDTAQDVLRTRQNKAKKSGQKPDAQAKNEDLAQQAQNTRDQKQQDYETARETLQNAIDNLEGKRDDQFKESVSQMCNLLQKLTPDWENVPSEEKAHSSDPGGDDEKDDGGSDPNPSGGSPAPDPAEGENTQNQTDSESD